STEVETQHLICPLRRGLSNPQADQQARNQGGIHLDAYPVDPLTQHMSAAQHPFDPTEKQFYRPPIAIGYGQQLRVQVQPIRDQDHDVWRPILRVLPVATCTRRNGGGSTRVWWAGPKRRRIASRTTPACTAAGARARSSCTS